MADSNTPTKGGNQPVTTPNGKTPTSSDAMFFFMIVKNMKSKADIDWAGVAVDHGFKNAEVAKVRFGQVKRKLGIGESSTPTKTPAKSPAKATTPKEAKVKKTPAGRTSTKGKKGKKGGNDDKVKMEDIPDSKVKGEDVEDDDAEAQLQADMDKYINPDGEVEPLF